MADRLPSRFPDCARAVAENLSGENCRSDIEIAFDRCRRLSLDLRDRDRSGWIALRDRLRGETKGAAMERRQSAITHGLAQRWFWGREMSQGGRTALFILTAVLASCGESAEPSSTQQAVESVQTDPVPPEGFLADLPADERAAELARIAEGTPIDELPEEERLQVEATNARELLRNRERRALRSIAEAQAAGSMVRAQGTLTEQLGSEEP